MDKLISATKSNRSKNSRSSGKLPHNKSPCSKSSTNFKDCSFALLANLKLLEEQKEVLSSMVDLATVLGGNVAHAMRDSLTAARLYIELLENYCDITTAKHKSIWTIMRTTSNTDYLASTLLRQIKNLAVPN